MLFLRYESLCRIFNFKSTLILVPLLFFTVACERENTKSNVNSYYDLKGFVRGQVELLKTQKPSVFKTMISDGKKENLTSKSVNWEKELELFALADINKPAYTKSYHISSPDSLTSVYVLKTGETAQVQEMKIILDANTGKPSQVSARLLTKNRLYESSKDISLRCAERDRKWSIISYEIAGYQKLSILEPKKFRIIGQIGI